MCSKEAIGGITVVGGLIGIVAYSGNSLTKAVGAKLTADKICDCFCNVMSNISETVCHQAFDRAYGKGLYPPFDVTLFCGNEGGCRGLQSIANWGFVLPSLMTCVTAISLVTFGVCVYKHYSKQNPENRPLSENWHT